MLRPKSRWFNRNSSCLDNRESLLESELNVQLQGVEEFESHCKILEKTLKHFFEVSNDTKKKIKSFIEWYLQYLQFHNEKESNTWISNEFLQFDDVKIINNDDDTSISFVDTSNKTTSPITTSRSRISTKITSPPKPFKDSCNPKSHKRCLSTDIDGKVPTEPLSTSSFRRSISANAIPELDAYRGSVEYYRITSLYEELPNWIEILEQILKLRLDFTEHTDYLLLCAVINSSKEYVKKVNTQRKIYDKSRNDYVSAKTKLDKEKGKLLIYEPGKSQFTYDIAKLVSLEREKVRCQLIYESNIIELMDLLSAEKRNVDLGQSILKYLETQKRFYLRNYTTLNEHKENIIETLNWKDKLELAYIQLPGKRAIPAKEKKFNESKTAWKKLAKIITQENSPVFAILIQCMDKLCSTDDKNSLMESLIYLFISQIEPFPPELAPYVHLATKNISENEYFNSNLAKKLIRFLHNHYNIFGDNLRRYNSEDLLTYTSSLSNVVINLDIINTQQM